SRSTASTRTIGDDACGARVLAAGGVRDCRGPSLLFAGAGGRDPLNLARLALERVASSRLHFQAPRRPRRDLHPCRGRRCVRATPRSCIEGPAPAFRGRRSALIAEGPGDVTPYVTPAPVFSRRPALRPQPTRASDSRIVALGTAHIEIVRAAYAPSRKLLYV